MSQAARTSSKDENHQSKSRNGDEVCPKSGELVEAANKEQRDEVHPVGSKCKTLQLHKQAIINPESVDCIFRYTLPSVHILGPYDPFCFLECTPLLVVTPGSHSRFSLLCVVRI